MKFQQLPIGARFEYEGKVYTKVSPLAAAADGAQRLIPRYVALKPLSEPEPKPKATTRQRDERQVMAAFDAYRAEIERVVLGLCGDDEQRTAARRALEKARQAFVDALQ